MLEVKSNISKKIIHFNRWSNQSYAAFNSIGKIIRICALTKIIHGLSTVKSGLSEKFLIFIHEIDNKCGREVGHLFHLEHGGLHSEIGFDVAISSSLFNGSDSINNSFSRIIHIVLNRRPVMGLFYFNDFSQESEPESILIKEF